MNGCLGESIWWNSIYPEKVFFSYEAGIPNEKSRRDMGQIQAIKKDANQRDMNVTSHGDNRR